MNMSHTVETLDSTAAWSRLARVLGGAGLDVVRNTIRHLRVLDAQCYVLEAPYIAPRLLGRLRAVLCTHVSRPRAPLQARPLFLPGHFTAARTALSSTRLNDLADLAKDAYCGFCVIRPLSAAPIGRTVLLARVGSGFNMEGHRNLPRRHRRPPSRTRLQVTGTSFLQQDSRVGACAQVAIWAGMRHMHARHNYGLGIRRRHHAVRRPPIHDGGRLATQRVRPPIVGCDGKGHSKGRLSTPLSPKSRYRPCHPAIRRVRHPRHSRASTLGARSATLSRSSAACLPSRRNQPPAHSTTSLPMSSTTTRAALICGSRRTSMPA